MADTTPIALQLYSVRDDAKDDLAGVIRRVASWGYDGVEFAGFHGHSAQDVRAMLDDAGLRCPSSHARIETLAGDVFDQTIAFYKTLGCDTLIIPWLPEEKRNTLEACLTTAEFFNALAEKLRPLGMRTGFHVHTPDVVPLWAPAGDGRSPWDVFAQTTSNDFILQYDTANGMAGGVDPVEPIFANPGRSALLHLKEFGDGSGLLTGEQGHGKAVIGEGDVPWPQVLDAATTVGGVRWYIVEQEGHPSLAAMDAARRCLESLNRFLGR